MILAPHLTEARKKDIGLPHRDDATERQIRDGMYWDSPDDLYNDGTPFKLTLRDRTGIVVTLIADSYFGYCKKEVKTQISYACNLRGNCEEEHAGGAIAYPSFDLGKEFSQSKFQKDVDHKFEELIDEFGEMMELDPKGFAIDKQFPDIYYVPETVKFNLEKQTLTWTTNGGDAETIDLRPDMTYVLPSGYKVEMTKLSEDEPWRLIGTNAEGTFCHKPSTVSGGGKSEISKSLQDAMISGPVFVGELEKELNEAWSIVRRDFGDRYMHPYDPNKPSRPL